MTETTNTDAATDIERAAAMLAYVRANMDADATEDDIEAYSYDDTEFKTPERDVRILTDEEADERLRAYCEETLWAFNANFLADYMPEGIDADEIESIRGDRCEDANPALVALVKAADEDGLNRLAEDAGAADGRGHFLSSWDGEEIEFDHAGRTWFLYFN